MSLEGMQLGRYNVLQPLGSGGMGEVYLAEDPRIKQQVAIKVIRVDQSPYPNAPNAQTAVRLFQREARAIVSLDHPHILPLNDYGEYQQGKTSLVYLVMPYRPEGSLIDWINQQYPGHLVPADVVSHIVGQAAEALQHAHDHQITHADVKPANFLIRFNPKAPNYPDLLLSDFGIARLESATTSASQSIRGTPTYMAPEQCEGVETPASDQYALAVMAYELLTGRPPFQGNAMRLMYQHVNTPPEPPSTYNARLSQAVDEVLMTALSKVPEERFRSVTAFATAFTIAVQQTGLAEAPTRSTTAPLPGITGVLPETPLISATLADAPTRITSPQEPAGPPPSGPMTPVPSPLFAQEWPTPPPQGWANTPTGPTAPPLPETLSHVTANRDSHPNIAGMGAAAGIAGGIGLWAAHSPAGMGSAPAVPGASAGPQSGASSVPGVSAGPQSGALASHGASAVTGAGKVVAPKILSIIPTKVLAIILASVVVVGGGTAGVVLATRALNPSSSTAVSGPATSATVTITPASKDLNNSYTLSAVTGTPDASKQQVQARVLSATTPAYTSTVSATGQTTIPATHATGTLLFTNETFSSVTFYAGTTFSNNYGPGPAISIAINATITVDYASPASVGAHVVQAGSSGNIPSYDFADCYSGDCSISPGYILVQNNTSFTGGQDAQTYTSVQQSDIDNAANTLESANKPDPMQLLQEQIQPNEQWVGTPQCTPNVTSDHNAGDQATQVTVSVTFTCIGEVYDHTGAVTLATNALMQQAATDPGSGYALVGQIKTMVTNATVGDQKTVTLMVSAEGVWAYQFSMDQEQAFARMIAGKTPQEAQQLLAGQTGVAKVSIQLSGGQLLPKDPAKISIVMQTVQGAA